MQRVWNAGHLEITGYFAENKQNLAIHAGMSVLVSYEII